MEEKPKSWIRRNWLSALLFLGVGASVIATLLVVSPHKEKPSVRYDEVACHTVRHCEVCGAAVSWIGWQATKGKSINAAVSGSITIIGVCPNGHICGMLNTTAWVDSR